MFLYNHLISSLNSMDILDDHCKEVNTLNNLEQLQTQNSVLLDEVKKLRELNENLELKHSEVECKVVSLMHELDGARRKNNDCLKSGVFAVEGRVKEEVLEGVEVSKGRKEELKEGFLKGFEMLRLINECLMRVNEGLEENEFGKKEVGLDFELELDERKGMRRFLEGLEFVSRMAKRVEEKLSGYKEKVELIKEIEDCKRMNNVLLDSFSRDLEVICLINESLVRISEGLEVENVENEVEVKCNKLDFATMMVKRVEHKLNEYRERVKKEKRELEINVVSLTEENRDINALLRIALVEKEAAEKSLNKLKGDSEPKRGSLLQFAGRSLQRVGFGFFMGGSACEEQETLQKDGDHQGLDNLASNSSAPSDVSSDCEEEAVSSVLAVENLLKNLRLEVTHLRIALDESRSDFERLRNLNEKQGQKVTDLTEYIKELEDQKRTLTQNVEELLIEIKSTEEDAERWREACELEVKAGKSVIQERDKVVGILTQELDKTRAALHLLNKKLKSKEEVAVAAMAAQSAAERSLQLADSRAASLRERIQLLTRQLEKDDKHSRSKLRSICWPWLAFKVASPTNTDEARFQHVNVGQLLPEMQNLLRTD